MVTLRAQNEEALATEAVDDPSVVLWLDGLAGPLGPDDLLTRYLAGPAGDPWFVDPGAEDEAGLAALAPGSARAGAAGAGGRA